MLVTFAGTPLCSGVGKDSPAEFSKKSSRNVQTKEPLRAPAATMIDRLNAKTEITFTICRDHGTINAAEDFALTHDESLPSSGLLTLTADDGAHVNVKTRYLANAVLQPVSVKYKGILSWSTYVFMGGQVLNSKPT